MKPTTTPLWTLFSATSHFKNLLGFKHKDAFLRRDAGALSIRNSSAVHSFVLTASCIPRLSNEVTTWHLFSWSRRFPPLLKPKVHFCAHKRQALDSIQNKINPGYTLTTYLSKIHFNIVFPFTSVSYLQVFSLKSCKVRPCVTCWGWGDGGCIPCRLFAAAYSVYLCSYCRASHFNSVSVSVCFMQNWVPCSETSLKYDNELKQLFVSHKLWKKQEEADSILSESG
jgi:hypothetical protein